MQFWGKCFQNAPVHDKCIYAALLPPGPAPRIKGPVTSKTKITSSHSASFWACDLPMHERSHHIPVFRRLVKIWFRTHAEQVRLAMEVESDRSLTDSVHVKQPTRFTLFRGGAGAADAVPGSRMQTLTRGERNIKEWVMPKLEATLM
jgi:hypothetical protein